MIKDIVTDKEQLKIKSEKATPEDKDVIQDLLDTFEKHSETAVCLAANQIGAQKRIIVINNLGTTQVMVNPMITDKKKPYLTQEECCSLKGVRKCKRFKRIAVEYLDESFEKHEETFTGYIAEVIQHGVDHCNGILI